MTPKRATLCYDSAPIGAIAAKPPGEIEHHLIIIKDTLDAIDKSLNQLSATIDPIMSPGIPYDTSPKPEANCQLSADLALIVSRLQEMNQAIKMLNDRVRL